MLWCNSASEKRSGIRWPFWKIRGCKKKCGGLRTVKRSWKMPVCVTAFFTRLLSIKMFVFFVFVILRFLGLTESSELVSLGFFVIGANSGMKIYHGIMERGRNEEV